MDSSPATGSALAAQSLLGIFPPSPSLCPFPTHAVSFSLNINKLKKIIKGSPVNFFFTLTWDCTKTCTYGACVFYGLHFHSVAIHSWAPFGLCAINCAQCWAYLQMSENQTLLGGLSSSWSSRQRFLKLDIMLWAVEVCMQWGRSWERARTDSVFPKMLSLPDLWIPTPNL